MYGDNLSKIHALGFEVVALHTPDRLIFLEATNDRRSYGGMGRTIEEAADRILELIALDIIHHE